LLRIIICANSEKRCRTEIKIKIIIITICELLFKIYFSYSWGLMVQPCGGGWPPTTMDGRAGGYRRRTEIRSELRPDGHQSKVSKYIKNIHNYLCSEVFVNKYIKIISQNLKDSQIERLQHSPVVFSAWTIIYTMSWVLHHPTNIQRLSAVKKIGNNSV